MKVEILVKLDTVEKVKAFVQTVTDSFPQSDVDIMSSQNMRYCVDAKSILGIFSLDLSQQLKVVIANASEEEKKKLEETMIDFQ